MSIWIKMVLNYGSKLVYLYKVSKVWSNKEHKCLLRDIHSVVCSVFRLAQDIRSPSATESQRVLSSSLNDSRATLLACLCTKSKQTRTNSSVVLLKPSHYFLLWNGAGFLRMLSACNPLGGNHNGKQAAGRFNLHSSTLSGTTPGAQAWKAHSSVRKFRS